MLVPTSVDHLVVNVSLEVTNYAVLTFLLGSDVVFSPTFTVGASTTSTGESGKASSAASATETPKSGCARSAVRVSLVMMSVLALMLYL